MNKEYLVIDSCGFILAHIGGQGQPFDGLHFGSVRGLPPECISTIESLLNDVGAEERQQNRASRTLDAAGVTFEIRLVEAIRVERAGCNLKRTLMESLRPLSQQAKEARAQLTVKVLPGISEQVLVDPDKILWATTSLVRAALLEVKKGTLLNPGGKVEVELSYDSSKKLVSVLIEGDVQERGNPVPWGVTAGKSSADGKLVRAIVEAHGGILVWENFPSGRKMATRVSFTIPAL